MSGSSKLFLSAVLCIASHAPASANSVHGTVRDAATLQPVVGAAVALHIVNPDSIMLPTVSDGSGQYSFPHVPTGNEVYALICSQSGYAGFYARILDPGPGDETFDVFLEEQDTPPPPPPGDPDTSIVTGRVLTQLASGSLVGVPYANLMLHSSGGDFQAQTDASGGFTLHVSVGSYAVAVSASGYGPLTDRIEAPSAGLTYTAVLEHGTVGVPPPGGPAARVVLRGAVPNPFTQTAQVLFWLARDGQVDLRIYDLAGREVRALALGWLPAGDHAIPFSLEGFPGGTYFCRLRLDGEATSKPMTSVH